MAAKFPAFLALLITMTLLFCVAVHGCQPSCSSPATPPPPPPPIMPTPPGATCPINTADLSVCVDLLGLNYVPSLQCCTLLQGLANADAALCVCEAVKVLGVVIPVNVDVLLNECGKTCPPGSYTCPL